MRIYLDARNINENPAGVGRYALDLIPRLVEQAPEFDWVIVRHTSNRRPFADLLAEFYPDRPDWDHAERVDEVWIDVPIHNAKNLLKGGWALNAAFREFGPPDLFHDLFHILPPGLPSEVPIVLTLHDLVWIDHADASQPTWVDARAIEVFARKAIPYALKRADHVISISQPTDERAREWLEDTPSTIIMHGVDERFFAGTPESDGIIDKLGRYVVAVGNAKPYKNLKTLVRAIGKLRRDGVDDLSLALIGNCSDLMPLIEAEGLAVGDEVVLPGFVDDEGLRRWLGNADLFVFPSLIEGFGLPPLEAMAMGTPAIVSNYEPMATIAGDAALLVDPLDVDAMAEAIMKVHASPEEAQRLREVGRAHAATFSWDDTAARTLAIYRSLLETL